MSKHRAERPRRLRARYGRIAAAGVSLSVTVVALLGGVGIIPIPAGDRAEAGADLSTTGAALERSDPSGGDVTGLGAPQGATPSPSPSPSPTSATAAQRSRPAALPAGTGTGRRVVFSESAQRVWLVDGRDKVVSTYLVSGSLTDNLKPGSYAVYSRSRWAVGIDDSGVMQYFVRFTRGNNAAIGFHSIPTKNGQPLQTVRQLGTPQSHGCIRQKLADAQRLWDFAPVGTDVVVV